MARTEDPRTAPPIRWGILGAGGIAAVFASAVNAHTRAQLVAVGSRNRDRAERFATAHGIPSVHVGYRQLVERRPGRRRVRRDPALGAPRARAAGDRGRQARPRREGLHAQRRRGGADLHGGPRGGCVRHGGDVDAVPAARRRAPPGHRRRRDRRHHQRLRRPRPVLRLRPEEPAVRPEPRGRRAARSRRVPGVVRARLPGRPGLDPGRRPADARRASTARSRSR